MPWSARVALLLVFVLTTACQAIVTPPPTATPPPTTTPTLRTTAVLSPSGFLTPIPPTATLTPTPSPTPVVHIVVQGDTLFGIALEYGVSMDALVQANGLDVNQYLSIGQVLVIPMATEEEGGELGMVAPVGHMILATPTPLPLEIVGATLYQTPVDGVWCMGEVANTTDGPITNIQVQVTLVTADGIPLQASTALAAADYLAPGARAPFAVLFKAPPTGYADIRVNLLRGEAVSAITASFVPLDVVQPTGAVSGPQYRVAGLLVNNSGVAVNRIAVVVTLYDVDGKVIGYRQTVLDDEIVLPAGQSQEFKILLMPQGLEPPASFQVLSWGVR